MVLGSFLGGAAGMALGAGFPLCLPVAVGGAVVIVTALHNQRRLSRRQSLR
ncbi:MAG: hypothetical protein M0Z46_07850 [Actinomycetota bacterium]|nr:hypothetical protein [Actinomycetota bacterium]